MHEQRTWLYVISWRLAELGGVNQVVSNLFDRTRAQLGFEPLLLVRSWEHADASVSIVDGRRTVHARVPSPWFKTHQLRNALAYVVKLPSLAVKLAKLLRERHVTVVNVHYPDLSALVWVVLRDWFHLDIRLVWAFHGMDVRAATAGASGPRWLWRWVLHAADRIVVCADDLGDILRMRWGVPADRIVTIGNGVDVRHVQEVASIPPTSPVPKPYIMSIGTYEAKKGHDLLIQAFAQLAERHPQWSLVIAGRAGEPQAWERAQRLRAASPAPDRVVLLKDVAHPEAMRLLRGSSIFALASRQEPFGIVVLEAGALGRPAVVSDACGVVRKLSPGVDIETVPNEDVDALARALDAFMSDPARAQQVGSALRQRVESEFDWSSVVRQWSSQVLLQRPSR